VDKEIALWNNARSALQNGQPCMLLAVVESIGSSPGRAGFKALVIGTGELHGSIGGGFMEHKLVELARVRLADGAKNEAFLKRQIHRTEEPADRSGMICSGEQTIAFVPLDARHADLAGNIATRLEQGQAVGIQLDPTGIQLIGLPSAQDDKRLRQEDGGHWRYCERLGAMPRITILGGGHVGLALSRTMNQLGFHVHIMDDRSGLNTMEANAWANERLVADYARIGDLVPGDPDGYVVLVSFGYRTDDMLLRQLVRKPFKYLGMMGSAGKIRKLLADLRADGFSEAEIARIRTPIGLPIRSETPEEIAVSIAAEIIAVKNGM
jgi:xanthine dehydrogenase accessory factor